MRKLCGAGRSLARQVLPKLVRTLCTFNCPVLSHQGKDASMSLVKKKSAILKISYCLVDNVTEGEARSGPLLHRMWTGPMQSETMCW